MKKTVKIILWALVGVAVAAYSVYAATAPLAVEAITLEPQTARLHFTEQGIYTYQEHYAVYPRMAGEIVETLAREGDVVRPGDPLVVIEASDLEFELAQLEHTIAGYEAQQQQARELEQQQRTNLSGSREGLLAQIKSIDAQLENWEKQSESLDLQLSHQYEVVAANRRLVRYANDAVDYAEDTDDEEVILAAENNAAQARQLLASSELLLEQLAVSGQPRAYYEGQRESLQAEITAIDARLAKDYAASSVRFYTAQIEALRSRMEQLAHNQGKAETASPVAGVLTELFAAKQNVAGQQTPIAMIGQSPALEVYVPTRDVAALSVGDTVEVTLLQRLGDESIAGKIISIEREAEARLSPLGVEEYKVKLLVSTDAKRLLIGGSVDVTFTVFEREDSLVVPKTAVFSQESTDFVWVLRDGVLAKQPVVKGIELREGYLIEEGLAPGALVLRDANNDALAEGRRAVTS